MKKWMGWPVMIGGLGSKCTILLKNEATGTYGIHVFRLKKKPGEEYEQGGYIPADCIGWPLANLQFHKLESAERFLEVVQTMVDRWRADEAVNEVNPETEQEITFRDLMEMEHPEAIQEKCYGGVLGCPRDYGYEDDIYDECWIGKMVSAAGADMICNRCWNRPVPAETLERLKAEGKASE